MLATAITNPFLMTSAAFFTRALDLNQTFKYFRVLEEEVTHPFSSTFIVMPLALLFRGRVFLFV